MRQELWTLRAAIAVELRRADNSVRHVATNVLRVHMNFLPPFVPGDGDEDMCSIKVDAVGQQAKDGQIVLWDIFANNPGVGISLAVRASNVISRVPVTS